MRSVKTVRLLFSAAVFALAGLAANAINASGAVPVALQRPFTAAPAKVYNGLVYVANSTANSITAYPTSASGNARPSITIAGPHTRLNRPIALAHDPQGRLFVVCFGELLVFARGANGDATPVRSLEVSSYPYLGANVPVLPVSVAVDPSGYTYVGVTAQNFGDSAAVAVYRPAAQGADAPLRTFDYDTPFAEPEVAVDRAGQVYVVVPVDRFNPPGLRKFSGFATGNAVLSVIYFNSSSSIDYCCGSSVAVSPASGRLYAINNDHISIYNPAFTKAIGIIFGPATGIGLYTSGIAVDGSEHVYLGVPNIFSGGPRVEIFAADSHGNVAPSRIIKGPNTGLDGPVGLTLID